MKQNIIITILAIIALLGPAMVLMWYLNCVV